MKNFFTIIFYPNDPHEILVIEKMDEYGRLPLFLRSECYEYRVSSMNNILWFAPHKEQAVSPDLIPQTIKAKAMLLGLAVE